jgi:hypothetical protein
VGFFDGEEQVKVFFSIVSVSIQLLYFWQGNIVIAVSIIWNFCGL